MYTDNNVIMMRSLQPTSALPMTRNMPYYSASVPSRNQPRNMTGIYLGLEGNVNPPANRETKITRARTGVSQKVRTPAEDRRYKMVELLRIKEETKGFKGKMLKKHQPMSTDLYGDESPTPRCSHPKQLKHRKWGPAKSADPKHFNDVIKRNPRNYTGIMNNGVTRSENLTGMMSFADQFGWDISNIPMSDALVEEVHRMANENKDLSGLEECFKKVCKGNVESLHSLLPLRKPSSRPSSYTPGPFTPGHYSTGFTVRSYRNPNKAEILADFNLRSEHTRPKTVPATGSHNQRQQPLVPAPYFFKHFNRTGTANSTKKRNSPNSQFEAEQNNVLNGDKIFGGPGSGALSRSLNQGRKSAWSEGEGSRIRKGTPRNDSPIKDIDRFSRHDSSVLGTGPLEIRAEGFQLTSEDKAPLSDRTAPGDGNITNRSETNVKHSDRKTVDKSGNNKNLEVVGQSQFGMEGQPGSGDKTIRLDLETEDGKKQEIFLDDKELIPSGGKERRASEARVASMQEDAKQRKKDLEQILDEHEEIVKTIVRQASHDSSNETFQSDQRDQ